nr:E3 ubiquitin-protein ligase RGLG2-like [Ipomoea batatas]
MVFPLLSDMVTDALARAGLESSNLIVGIDFTKSNEWTGARSFHRKSLHHIGNEPNPYEQAISIIGRTLSKFDEDNLIPCFGFGDASTHDQEVFSFFSDERFCNGFEEVMSRYRELVPQLRLAGPTSFAPIIEMAITIVEQSGGQYHVLLIIADGQVTRSVDTGSGQLSPQEKRTVEAIVKARPIEQQVPRFQNRSLIWFSVKNSMGGKSSKRSATGRLSASYNWALITVRLFRALCIRKAYPQPSYSYANHHLLIKPYGGPSS